jgi:hypothetical protein
LKASAGRRLTCVSAHRGAVCAAEDGRGQQLDAPLGMVERQEVVGRRVDDCVECLRVLAESGTDHGGARNVTRAADVNDRHAGPPEDTQALPPPSVVEHDLRHGRRI